MISFIVPAHNEQACLGRTLPAIHESARAAGQSYEIIVVVTEPIWSFTPWSLTPLASPLGKIRFVIGTFLCHLGMLFWPIGIVLFVSPW